MKHFLLLTRSFLLFLFTTTAVNAADLRLIIASADEDASIGQSVAYDMNEMEKFGATIAKATGLNLKKDIFNGSNFTKETVTSFLRDLRVGSDDTVLFYYTGHGGRFTNTPTPWPDLILGQNPTLDDFYSFKSVADTLEGKGARLVVLISDACNNVIDRGASTKGFRKSPYSDEGLRKLFRDSEGLVMVSSTSIGEYAIGDNYGGVFSRKLFKSLEDVTKTSPTWSTLADSLRDPIPVNMGSEVNIQTPYWLLAVNEGAGAAPPPQKQEPVKTKPDPVETDPGQAKKKECTMNDYFLDRPECD